VTIKQLLIIDDDRDILKLTQTCLEIMGGWQVLTADSGAQGVLKAQANQPDVILLDVMMPEIDGLATLYQFPNMELQIRKSSYREISVWQACSR